MPVRIKLTETTAEREAVYRFRYCIYVEEMGRIQKHADHANKRIEEPLDKHGHVFAAYDENSCVVGTQRLNVGVDENFGDYDDMYNLRAFGPFYPDAVSISTKLMVAPAYRRSTLSFKLGVSCFKRGIQLGSAFDVMDCNPPLVDFFKKFGYRQVFPNINHPEYGDVVPLVLSAHDVDHMERCGSPFAKFAPRQTDERQSVAFFYDSLCKHPGSILTRCGNGDLLQAHDSAEQASGALRGPR